MTPKIKETILMETTKQLLNASKNKTMGNHSVVHINNGAMCRNFTYHYTCIVEANDTKKTFTISNGGYDTNSTNKALSSYIYELESDGYTLALHNEADIDSCEAKYYRLPTKADTEVSKKDLSTCKIENAKEGSCIKCAKYLIHIKWNGGRTLVTDEYGCILWKLPQFITNYIG
jgi:hypothetical protein